jgi:hypothetical protein
MIRQKKSAEQISSGTDIDRLFLNYLHSNRDTRQQLGEFLEMMERVREKNELIYDADRRRIGVGAIESLGRYKQDLTYETMRIRSDPKKRSPWVEFGISHDNKIFLNPELADLEELSQQLPCGFNYQMMWFGVSLKAAGKIALMDDRLWISSDSRHFEFPSDSMPVILFALQKKGFPVLSEDVLLREERPIRVDYCGHHVQGNRKEYFLNEARFPKAKAIAENETLSVDECVSDLLLSIDDEILSKQKRVPDGVTENKIGALKKNIIEVLSLITETNLNEKPGADASNGRRGSLEEGMDVVEKIADHYHRVVESVQEFETDFLIDLSFVKDGIRSLFFYFSLKKCQLENEMKGCFGYKYLVFVKEDKQESLKRELKTAEASLSAYREGRAIPGRVYEQNDEHKDFFKFYTKDPRTALFFSLHDYTNGSRFSRFMAFVFGRNPFWGRNHTQAVDRFLKSCAETGLPDNFSITDVYKAIFNTEDSLEGYQGKQGTLYARLRFFGRLNNEVLQDQGQSLSASVLTEAENTEQEAAVEVGLRVVGPPIEEEVSAALDLLVETTEFSEASTGTSEPLAEKSADNVASGGCSAGFFSAAADDKSSISDENKVFSEEELGSAVGLLSRGH